MLEHDKCINLFSFLILINIGLLFIYGKGMVMMQWLNWCRVVIQKIELIIPRSEFKSHHVRCEI